MESTLWIKALIMGLVEGLTEFLPVSSTGHLIITGDILNFLPKDQRGVFQIFIQLGAIMAVCFQYRRKLFHVAAGFLFDPQSRRFVCNIMIAFIPIGFCALLLGKTIKEHLFFPGPVATVFVIGGFIIFWAEHRRYTVDVYEVDAMTWKIALKVGFAQCFALIPGTSRSGATIIGGMLFGLSRKASTEFSFFLAIPTITTAALYDLFQNKSILDTDMTSLLAGGFVMSFICALLAVRGLLYYISRHDFTAFAWYRIIFGTLVLTTAYSGVVNWSV